ncbi:cytochrome P450 6A1-like isoform X2 [Osmia bicornis bicornis]|uniref:cytochrome P450 6A1-like isoform X2 n=1 Tax=Osmia bicornis bicornis TaxID=1437191 RepID=UPI001EAE9A32|nr:cytochrome P450 6A1-like isoform X2 [Osmia bicornis bicornis]
MATYLEISCGFIAVFLALYYYFTSTFNYWKKRGIKGPEPIPVFGNIMAPMLAKQSLADFLTNLYKKYKNEPMIGIFARREPILIILGPDIIKDVLIKDFSKFANRGFKIHEIAEPLSQHLFFLEVERWRPLRTQLSPVFTSSKLKGIFSLILDCAKHLEKYMDTLVQKGEPIEIREVAAQYTTDVIGSCAFGIEMNSMSESESEFRKIGREIFSTNLTTFLKFKMKEWMPQLYNLLGYVLPKDKTMAFIERITISTMKYRKHNNIVRSDFINTLLELQKHPERVSGIQLTDTLLAAQAFVFFAAGFETSSTTIANAIYELAQNQEIQDKLREEIKEFDAKNNGEWKYETVKQMKYLDKVFRETLRKYPPLSFLSRKATENYTFENPKLTVLKDAKVWIPLFSIHRDPEVYPYPDKFDPERFSEDAVKVRHPMHYLPFGDGPRNCIVVCSHSAIFFGVK